MKLRKIIRGLAPYGVVRHFQKKHAKNKLEQVSFWEGYMDYIRSQSRCELLEESPVRTVVSVQGFGHSGSGAVVDLLREYDDVVVVGGVDVVGSCAATEEALYEVDFLRSAGGLFEMELYLNTHNVRIQDALLHRFVLLIQRSDLFQKVPETRKYFYEFFRQISTASDTFPYQVGNPHLDYKGVNNTLFLQYMKLEEYRNLCRKLLNSIFSCYPIKKSDILVLDQFVGDREYDLPRYLEYVPNLKPIVVYRDPRDVYVFAKKYNIVWLSASNVDSFLEYFHKGAHLLMTVNDIQDFLTGYYVVSFERLLKEYSDVVNEIESFVGLNSNMHTRPKSALRPDMSIKGVEMWKEHPELNEDFKMLARELPQFIYYK